MQEKTAQQMSQTSVEQQTGVSTEAFDLELFAIQVALFADLLALIAGEIELSQGEDEDGNSQKDKKSKKNKKSKNNSQEQKPAINYEQIERLSDWIIVYADILALEVFRRAKLKEQQTAAQAVLPAVLGGGGGA